MIQTQKNAIAACRRHPATAIAALLTLLSLAGYPLSADTDRDEMHRRLDFLVGSWSTSHAMPSRDGQAQTVVGRAVIEWTLGGSWLRHEFEAEVPGRGRVFETHMVNFVSARDEYVLYLFDHFGGEAGSFYGSWADDDSIVLTAEFPEEDGSTGYQRYTLVPVSDDEIWISRAFSDDGVDYHFEVKGVYSRVDAPSRPPENPDNGAQP